MTPSSILVLVRIAVLKELLKNEKDPINQETTRATLDFNYEVYKMFTDKVVNDDNIHEEFKRLPFVRSYKTKRVFKDEGKLYYELHINDESLLTSFTDDDHLLTVKAIIVARRGDYNELSKDIREVLNA